MTSTLTTLTVLSCLMIGVGMAMSEPLPCREAHMEPEDIVEPEPVALEDAPLKALMREALGLCDPFYAPQLDRHGFESGEFEHRLRVASEGLLKDVGETHIYLEEGE